MAKMTDKKPAKAKPKAKAKVSAATKAKKAAAAHHPRTTTVAAPTVRQPGVERRKTHPTRAKNGHMEVLRCEVSEELLKMNDREMLEDLIRGAVNKAIQKVRQLVAEETGKMATGLGLPPGMGLPGLE